MKKCIAVIGGGASGMIAAITAAKLGGNVTLYEAKDRLGKKILATGNGKCNYTNLVQNEECYRGMFPLFSKEVRTTFSVEHTIQFFKEIGIEPKYKNGYVYPNSEQASSVADAMIMELHTLPVAIEYQKVQKVQFVKDYYTVTTEKETKEFDKVILCCGSFAGMKDTKEFLGYEFAKSLGHSIVPIVPALVQLRCKEKWFKTIAGVRTEGIVTIYENKKQVAREQGELLFAEYGLSGIPIFQISRFASKALYDKKQVTCSIDLLPQFSLEQIEQLLQKRLQTMKQRTAEQLLIGLLNHKLNYILLKECGICPTEQSVQAFKKASEVKKLATLYKNLTCEVIDTNSFANAQICAGGVNTKEINPSTMESKLKKGLYMAGELVDVDGTCGGYNLQWAWSSGYVAGFHAVIDERQE